MSDRFVRWDAIQQDAAGLQAVTAHLTEVFGTEFKLAHLGGGCTAIQAVFGEGAAHTAPGDRPLLVWLSDSGESPQATAGATGWVVGVYDGQDPEAPLYYADNPMASHDNHAYTALLVRAALAVVRATDAGE